jgi:alpha-glucosidase
MTWIDSSDDVLAFARGDLVCVVNLGDEPATLPAHTDVLLSSAPLEAGLLPRDTAAWLRTPA